MMVFSKIFFIGCIIILNACSILISGKHPNGITATQSVFIDNTPKEVYLSVDNIVPDLESAIKNEIQNANLKIVNEKYDSKNLIILKVKTGYYGKASSIQIENLIEKNGSISTKEKTTIDHIAEDPSGIIIGFAVGAGMSAPIVTAPIGMAVGAMLNLMIQNHYSQDNFIVLEVEILEKSLKPVWYKDVRIYKTDETSTRTFDYSEETTWKTHKTRILIRGKYLSKDIAKRVVSLVL